jgi:hypothetical protein
MALIESSQLNALAESIVPAIPDNPSTVQIDARNVSVASVKDLCQKICQYIIDNLEINGIKVDTGSLLPDAPTVTPQDGGATLFSSTLKPSINDQDLTQSNDGKGLVL